ncbi:MAG: hypothetical protein IGS38_10160 [Synechococcales cyanobacterium M58_A2018_015]|nr:hypothetical protein [Synechococcales cyanobacterium M58_A2018_015]
MQPNGLKPRATAQLSDPRELLAKLQTLRQTVYSEGQSTFERWQPHLRRPGFSNSALNLAYYLALRRQDLRPLQAALRPWGLSSLGRIEAQVMPNLDAVIATLGSLCQVDPSTLPPRPTLDDFFDGERLLHQHTEELFGPTDPRRRVRIMVTLPTEAAEHYDFVKELLQRGAACVRINCAHDSASQWLAMVEHVRRAEQDLNRSCKILMDLGGPKPRTLAVRLPRDKRRIFLGDRVLLTPFAPPAVEPAVENEGSCTDGGNDSDRLSNRLSNGTDLVQAGCSIPEILDSLSPGAAVWIDDGKIGATVIETGYPSAPDQSPGVLLEITHVKSEGAKLKPDKGLNFPDTVLSISPLTDKDLQDLDFVVSHADIIGYSFVQTAADIEQLQQQLAQRLGERATVPAIVAKIETPEAVRNLPELIVHAAGKQPFGVMIARGDLAVEIGYQRLAEIQEEILWLCEAAHVPVIWATQVLENLVKTGVPSRGEITDAAMAERAECVMLNKGSYVAEAVTILDDVLTRMQAHQLKKTPQLRALRSW